METEVIENDVTMSMFQQLKFLGYFAIKVILYVIIVIFAIIYALFCLYFGNVLHNIHKNDDRPSLFNAYIIVSESMIPNIKVQDGVIIKRENIKKLERGDIITFVSHDPRYDGLIITHRIIGITKTENNDYYFRTKGDANSVEDTYLVQEKDLLGKVMFMVPKVGYVRSFISQSTGWILFVIIPASIIVVYDIYKLLEHINKKDKDKYSYDENEVLEVI